jgi:photosystem II stability/assembly factor-like uncharacterized protein
MSFFVNFCLRESVFCMNRMRTCFDSFFRSGLFAQVILSVLLLTAVPLLAAQQLWNATGPDGGDARAIAAVPGQPKHLFLGTTNSWLYESLDGGSSWRRLAKIGAFDDLILDHIIVDEANSSSIYVAGWRLDHPDGGLWVSRDGGRSWSGVKELSGQSIRAFAQSPSNPSMLVAGTLEGVFRSLDAGVSWRQISPPGSQEIHEVESLAIDPGNSGVIYAGTWHLPWKTTDGGKHWQNIKNGIIDDSDVFSIIIDPERPKIVFASACSGIYKSENAAELFRKIQGIPSTARRTRVLKQDPANREVVYAGTTEGLYKTVNGGKSFERMTGPDVIVNDVFVDPQNTDHVLLATDRGGVLSSTDGGASFVLANRGFSARKVEALLVDSGDSARLYAGVVNDKAYGGVFVSGDRGRGWRQLSDGLDGRDVFALAQSPDGTILAGTNHGIFALETDAAAAPGVHWSPRNTIQNTLVRRAIETHNGKSVHVEKHVKDAARVITDRVYALDLSSSTWLASIAGGLLTSVDQGASWQGGPVMGASDYRSVAAHGKLMAAVRNDSVVLSEDAGKSWMPISVPAMLMRIHCVAFSADGSLWLGAREGVFFSHNLGTTWMWVRRFPLGEVDDLTYDARLDRILASSRSSDLVYVLDPKSLKWKWSQTGYRINRVRAAGDSLLAASLYDGVLIEPRAAGVEIGQR